MFYDTAHVLYKRDKCPILRKCSLAFKLRPSILPFPGTSWLAQPALGCQPVRDLTQPCSQGQHRGQKHILPISCFQFFNWTKSLFVQFKKSTFRFTATLTLSDNEIKQRINQLYQIRITAHLSFIHAAMVPAPMEYMMEYETPSDPSAYPPTQSTAIFDIF